MAFDQKTRNLLQRTVTACRRILDREFTAQLQELYGIQPDGALSPLSELDHLADEQLEIAGLLRARINHLEGGEPAEGLTRTQAKPEHVSRVVREQAFTVLNRLAALRLSEERGLVLECVRQGVNSEGFQLFTTTAGNALGETHEAYRVYLHCLFDELALDLGVLFDRFSPLALLFPRKDALEEVLRELNGSGKAAENEAISTEQFAEIWKADEAIGWIYQYYNDEAERKKMREISSAPRNSRELAVRNQFFTPRYVVEFLTDNTLGRLWYEMTRGETVLRDRCRYLVRRPTEVFLKLGEAVPENAGGNEEQDGEHFSQEELLRQPVHIPHRSVKDPREIRLLDPACGSMHFGLYAFDLFTVIYDEAWEIAHGPDEAVKSAESFAPFVTFAGPFADKAAFLLEVPRLIIEHNIHGIDIDPRAVQIAGLSLWLRAQRTWHEGGIKPADRPRITRSNLVCAEPMPGERKLLREFVEGQFDISERPAFAFLLEKIFDHMALAGEAGSLLRIEEEIRSVIAEANALARPQAIPKQVGLFPEDEQPEPKQLDLQGLLDEHFWQRAEQRIYDALKLYAERAETDDGFQRRLFADDAAKGFAFIDLCRKRYDVVVMNPPFGAASSTVANYLDQQGLSWVGNILCAFVIRSHEMLTSKGRAGAIFDRSASIRSSYEEFRVRHIIPYLSCGLETGWNVLDANVETTVHTWNEEVPADAIAFFNVLDDDPPCKEASLRRTIDVINAGQADKWSQLVSRDLFGKLPNSVISCEFECFLVDLFETSPSIADRGLIAREGHTFSSGEHLRLFWEIPSHILVGPDEEYCSVYNGSTYTLFFTPIRLVGRYGKDAGLISPHRSVALRNMAFQFKRGVGYGKRGDVFDAHLLPDDTCFTSEGQAITGITENDALGCLALLNSSYSQYALNAYCGQHKRSGYVNKLPFPRTSNTDEINTNALGIISLKRGWSCFDETTREFRNPLLSILPDHRDLTLEYIVETYCTRFVADQRQLDTRIALNDRYLSAAACPGNAATAILENFAETRTRDIVWADYDGANHQGIDGTRLLVDVLSYCVGCAFGRWDIRCATGERPAPGLVAPFAPLPVYPPGMLQGNDGLPSPEAGRRLWSEGRYPLDVAWDGILVDDPEHPLDLERRIQAALAVLWGDRADALEHEACELLSVPTLREWFHRPAGFFADHLKRYSKSQRQAPIYWPLSTASGRYTLWLYYHRLTSDTLYKCLQQFVGPKLADVEKELTRLRILLAGNEGGARERSRLEELEGLRRELIELRTELEHWAPKWKPNLNDGVLINAAPLWKLFRLPKWQKDLKACWQELENEEYDWAHLAYSLWPDRVREKCKTDRSLAIAHGLEEICELKSRVKKVKKSKIPKPEDDQQELPKD
jgi:hypothetical protein